MLIQFKRSRLRAIIDAIDHGRYITCLDEGGVWEDNELLAVAGACMSELMARREATLCENTDEPLRCHQQLPYDRLSTRLAMALNYALCVTSTLRNCNVCDDEKNYKTEVVYEEPQFMCMKPLPAIPDDEPPSPDGSTPRGETPAPGNAVMHAA